MDVIVAFILGVVGNIISQFVIDNHKSISKKLVTPLKLVRRRKRRSSYRWIKIRRKIWNVNFAFRCFMFPQKYLTEEGKKSVWNIHKLNSFNYLKEREIL